MATETVLVVGSSGNIGVSTIIAALRSKRNVLAVVRNRAAQDKVLQHVTYADKSLPTDNITFVEADPTEENGIEGVIDQVKAGKLPDFQHVYSTVGLLEMKSPIYTVDLPTYHKVMQVGYSANFYTYRSTAPYLISQGNPNATWTLITGGAGEHGFAGVTAVTQGALFSLANVACRENADTNIRFNEVYLMYYVAFDSKIDENPASPLGGTGMKASEFAAVYEKILADKAIDASRVSFHGPQDLPPNLKYKKKLSL